MEDKGAVNEPSPCPLPQGEGSRTSAAPGVRVVFQPERFGAQSREEMQTAAEEAGRAFTLAFLFEPFELCRDGLNLVTTDDQALVYTVYCLVSGDRQSPG